MEQASYPTTKRDFVQLQADYEQVRLAFLQRLQQSPPTGEKDEGWLREIFDLSRQIGLQHVPEQQFWTTKKIATFLGNSNIPCLSGEWEVLAKGLWQFKRLGCESACQKMCRYWQESLDGLVMGLGDTTRYARHQCRADGDPVCVDVLYDFPLYDQRWGEIPASIQACIPRWEQTFAEHQFRVEWKGYATGCLYYQLHDQHPQLAAHRYSHLVKSIQQEIQKEQPHLKTQEVSPRAVWQGE